MDASFELLSAPRIVEIPSFRFCYRRTIGPYTPWSRIAALDDVAEALETAEVARLGPAFGVYHDLPAPAREPLAWRADLGYPIADDGRSPRGSGCRSRMMPALQAAGLRYRGDLASFPPAFELLLEWLAQRDVAPRGPLLERFHVSNPLTGEEERDVWIALETLPA